jgi:branched-chain amino acid transport system permease protein
MKWRLGIALQLAIASVVAIGLPVLLVHGDYGRHLLILTLILGTLAISLNLVMGYAGLVSVAHGAFFGIGAYTTALMTVNGYPFTVSVFAGMLLAAFTGALLGIATLRLRGHYFAVATLAFTMVAVIILERWEEVTRGARGVANIPRPTPVSFRGVTLSFADFWPMYVLLVCVVCLFVLVAHLVVHSPFGKSLLCIQRNELLGKVYGVNVVWVKLRVIALSAAMTSVSGSLYAVYIAYVSPNDANFMRSFEAIMYVVVGGTGTTWGPLLGAVFVHILPELLRGFDNFRLLILGGILVAVVRFYPAGLAGGIAEIVKFATRLRRPNSRLQRTVTD